VTDFQQYLDFLYGRALRTTLLCREEVAVRHQLVPAAVRDLWISSSAVPISSDGTKLTPDQIHQINFDDPAPVIFRADECTTSVASRIGKAAMVELSFAHPRPLAFDAFVKRVQDRLAGSAAPEDASLAAALAPIAMEWFAMRLVELRAFEPPMATEPGARPIASAVARYQVANGWGSADAMTLVPPGAIPGAMPTALRGHASETPQSVGPQKTRPTDGTAHQVTSLLHRRVHLGGELAGQVLLRLDGTNDRAAIANSLAEPVLSGQAEIRVDSQAVTDPDAVRKLLSDRVGACIADFARNALLIREVANT
jgi:methyltransferase-like protein